ATTETYTLSLHDALPISFLAGALLLPKRMNDEQYHCNRDAGVGDIECRPGMRIGNVQIEKEKIDHVSVKKAISKISHDPRQEKRSEEHTSELQSLAYLVC